MAVYMDDITIFGGFYRRFIKDFSKIAKPLCELLVKILNFFGMEGAKRASRSSNHT